MRSFLAAVMAASVLCYAAPAPAVELESIVRAAADYHNPNARLETMYRAALVNTSRQATVAADGTAYVKTGDIPAEWLRDASAQVRPYLFFAKSDVTVAALLRGIIAREGKYLQVDPYANAFTIDYRVWEQKFELDSLAYPIELAWSYWKATGDASIFTPDEALGFERALETMEREQDHAHNSKYAHRELRDDNGNPGPNPVAYTGMIWTGFRPSDDACKYNYLIPSEMMAVVALGDLEEIERSIYHNLIRSNRAKTLRAEVQDGIQKYGEVFTPNYGYVYAYEVDGLGHQLLMDDANIPSLLAAPYLGYTKADSFVYKNTRRFLLSRDDPYYYVGIDGARHRQRSHERQIRLAARAHRRRLDGHERRRATRRARTIARERSRRPPLARIVRSERSGQVLPQRFRVAERALFRVRDDRVQRHAVVADGRHERSRISRRMMQRNADVVLGIQWGDEGKGRVVDSLAADYDMVARFGGGDNAGHTLVVGDRKLALRIVPSGVLQDRPQLFIGGGTVISLDGIAAEFDMLAGIGVDVSRIKISDRAHVVFSYHAALDRASEKSRGEMAIGTTGRGIGPAYTDKAARVGITFGELRKREALADKIRYNLLSRASQFAAMESAPREEDVIAQTLERIPRVLPHVVDGVTYLHEFLESGKRVLVEGAQGTLLDVGYGTYPYVTSSHTIAGGACTGLGLGPTAIGDVIGVAKAYATRVGAGPFPSELFDATGERLRERGGEFGTVTGRPRRCGWFDAVAARYARRVNGLTRADRHEARRVDRPRAHRDRRRLSRSRPRRRLRRGGRSGARARPRMVRRLERRSLGDPFDSGVAGGRARLRRRARTGAGRPDRCGLARPGAQLARSPLSDLKEGEPDRYRRGCRSVPSSRKRCVAPFRYALQPALDVAVAREGVAVAAVRSCRAGRGLLTRGVPNAFAPTSAL